MPSMEVRLILKSPVWTIRPSGVFIATADPVHNAVADPDEFEFKISDFKFLAGKDFVQFDLGKEDHVLQVYIGSSPG